MSSVKTKIKNDLWKWNYTLPFVKKHQFDEKGKVDMARHVMKSYINIKPVKAKGVRSVGTDTKALLSSVNVSLSKESRFVYFIDTQKTIAVPGNILSNFTLDYDKIIHGSFKELVSSAIGNDEYGREALAVSEEIENLVNRIITALENSDIDETVKRKRISDFSSILIRPAVHFEEALQRILFFNQIMWQTRHRLNGLGRLDLILADYYYRDIQNSKITKEMASDIVADFLSQLSKYSGYKSDALEGDIGQIIILGGLNGDGSYFSNDLTRIFLKEQAKFGKPDPKTLIRVSHKMPDDLLRAAVESLKSKTGSPLFSNDDVVIPALKSFGMSDEDAYSYCVSACWEPYIVGKSLDQNNIAVFDFFSALDEVLNTKEPATIDELIDEYITENNNRFKTFLKELDEMKWAKDPLVSLFMDGCNSKRRDVSEGATKYNNYGITTVALSNVVDSLMNIKKIVYDNHELTLKELNECRNSDYKSNRALYNRIVQSNHHYGHQDQDTIVIVNRITSNMAQIAAEYQNKLGGTVKFGLSSPGYNILSKKTAADVSGRKQGMPYSTHISAIDAPYTEVVNFASGLEYDKQRFNGNVVDFFISPGFIDQNVDKFTIFMKGAIKCGYFQMQMNIMDSKTLIDAKKNPDKYPGLIVRVWGFSAYFNDLPESYKDLLIERAVAAERLF